MLKVKKGWLAIATLKPTFTFLGRDFVIFNTFTWENPNQKSESLFKISDGKPAITYRRATRARTQ